MVHIHYQRRSSTVVGPALYHSLNTHLLAWEAWLALPEEQAPLVKRHIEMESLPQTLSHLIGECDRQGWLTDDLRLAWAITCHRFSQSEKAASWLTEGRRALKHVKEPRKDVYSVATQKIFSSTSLTEQESAELKWLRESYPEDWFVVHLSRAHHQSGAESASFTRLRENTLGKMFVGVLLNAFVVVMAFPCTWFMWRSLKSGPLHQTHDAHRLARLWPVSAVLGVWSIAGIGMYIGADTLGTLGGALVNRSIAEPWAAYWIRQWFSLACSCIAMVAIPVLMKFCFTRSSGILRYAFGLGNEDFIEDRSIFRAVSSAFSLLGLSLLLAWLIEQFHPQEVSLNWLTRSFSYLGDGALPAALLFAGVLAPLVEELVFRGFLFASMRAKWGVWPAALVSSLLFSAGHGYDWIGTVHVFGLGMAFCMLFQRTGRISVPILTHSLFNIILVVRAHLEAGL